jgi:hypothetical protein
MKMVLFLNGIQWFCGKIIPKKIKKKQENSGTPGLPDIGDPRNLKIRSTPYD